MTPAFTRSIGARARRREDGRLLAGTGSYVDDVRTGGHHAAFVRSGHAHALVGAIDTEAARALPGVIAVYTADDLEDLVGPLAPRTALATDEVVYVGEPVVIVVATSRAVAEDGADLVEVGFEALPPVVGIEQALRGDARTDTKFDDNVVDTFASPGYDEAVAALAASPHVFEETFTQHRYVASPMEGHGIVARWDTSDARLTVWVSSQGAHASREQLAGFIGLGGEQIRVIVGDVGGGFGQKIGLTREEKAVALAARALNGTVRWIEDRWENLVSGGHSREEQARVRVGTDDEGRLLALVVDHVGDVGYQGSGLGFIMTMAFQGGYRIPNAALASTSVRTNTMMRTAYRGPWMYETVARESMLDVVARGLGIDAAALRARNVLQLDELPAPTPSGTSVEAISPAATLTQALEILDYDAFREEQRDARAAGRRLGVGISMYVEPTSMGFGLGASEGAVVRIDTGGKVQVTTSTSSQGHSIETTLAQVVADTLGVPYEHVTVTWGDTAATPIGPATGGSRNAVMGGGAALEAATEVRRKVLAVGAHLLEASVDDLELVEGSVRVRGVPASARTIAELASISYLHPDQLPEGETPGFEVSTRLRSNAFATYSNATHVCTCEVDLETGIVHLLRYVVSEDCGVMINPTVVEGQIAGGVAEGIGGVLLEHLAYDAYGTPLATTFLDYLLPTATDVPTIEYGHIETPSTMPGGFKGVGEGGAIASPAAVINAVADALAHLGVRVTDQPLSPDRLRALVEAAADATAPADG